MGSKNKLKRFKENKSFSNVIQPTREELLENRFPLRGNWREAHFKNSGKIILELGCGKGEYTLALASKHPEHNFIGIDIKGARFWRGAKTALEEEMNNVAFLRMQIELVDLAFAKGEVDEIWLTFPDPQIKYKRTKHRMTNQVFLDHYANILRTDGTMHLKTDSEFLHGYTLGVLHAGGYKVEYANHDIYNSGGVPEEVTSVKTFYEQQYLEKGKAITYIRFKLN